MERSAGKNGFRRFLPVVGLLLVLRVLAMALMPLADPSEARYAAISVNMARSGNFVEPTLIHNGAPTVFQGKPPLFFQMAGKCCQWFGESTFAVRLPSLFCAVLLLMMLYGTLRRRAGRTVAEAAVLLALMSPLFTVFAGLAMTDVVLALAAGGAVLAYLDFTLETDARKRKRFSLQCFALLGIGMVAKGPVALVEAGLPLFFFILFGKRWKDLKDHAWFGGIVLFCAIAVPWYWMMQLRHPDFLRYFFVDENFKRFLFHDYGDRYGEGREFFHGAGIVWCLSFALPGILLLLAPLCRKAERSAMRFGAWFRDPVAQCTFLGFAAPALFWSLTSRALLYYLLPAAVFPAAWGALLLERTGNLAKPHFRLRIAGLTLGIGLVLGIGEAVLYRLGPEISPRLSSRRFAETAAEIDRDPALAGRKFHFAGDTPYSAEFAIPGRAVDHAKEHSADYRQVLRRSPEALLWVDARWRKKIDRAECGPAPVRPVWRETAQWRIYAPLPADRP